MNIYVASMRSVSLFVLVFNVWIDILQDYSRGSYDPRLASGHRVRESRKEDASLHLE